MGVSHKDNQLGLSNSQVSEQVTLSKAILHLPRARMCQAREKKAPLDSEGVSGELGRGAWESGIERGRAAE